MTWTVYVRTVNEHGGQREQRLVKADIENELDADLLNALVADTWTDEHKQTDEQLMSAIQTLITRLSALNAELMSRNDEE